MDRPSVVIVGGGFAGLNAARSLSDAEVDITIVDRRNFHLFQPLLYQVATAALNPSDIAYPIRAVFKKQRNVIGVILGEVTSIDVDGHKLVIDEEDELAYDYLILATGATHSYFGHDDWAEAAPGLKTIEDALLIRRRILRAFELAERNPDDADRYLTFVVVGAGPTGVELAGAMVEIALHSLSDEFDTIDPSRARVILFEGAEEVLPSYSMRLRRSAHRQLEELGVEVRTASLVSEIDETGVTLDTGEHIGAATVMWAAGVQASPLGAMLGAETDRAGRVVVSPDLSLPGHPEAFVVGDLALVMHRGEPVPGVAPAAMQQGRHAARQIINDLEGRPRGDFRYRDKGALATIGRARAVAQLPGLSFSGLPAWAAWLAIHIFFLIGFRNRVFVFLSWAWHYLSFRKGARIITNVEPDE